MRELGWALVGAALLTVQLVLARACLVRPVSPALEVVVVDATRVTRSESGALPTDAHVVAAEPARVRTTIDDASPPVRLAPGWHRQAWRASYGAGGEHRVTRSVLAGPFQRRVAPPCGVRLVLGQTLLDALRPVLVDLLHAALRGQLGYRRVDELELVFDGEAQALVIRAALRFAPGVVRLRVALTPAAGARGFALRSEVRAEVAFGSSLVARLVDDLGQTSRVNRLVTDVARKQVERALAPVALLLTNPPRVPLVGGIELELIACPGAKVVIHDRAALVLPLALVPPKDAPPPMLPDSPPPSSVARVAAGAPLALELDANVLGALLAHLHERGELDRALADAGLDTRFNTDDAVTSWLTLRVSPPRLAAAPLIEAAAGDVVGLALELALDVRDGALSTPAHLFLRLTLTAGHAEGGAVTAAAHVVDLDLTCAPSPTRLTACYPQLMERARAAAGALDEPIAAALAGWLGALLVARDLDAPGAWGARLASPQLAVYATGATPWLRVAWPHVAVEPPPAR